MYDFKRCTESACDMTALHGSEYCAGHHPDAAAYASTLLASIAGQDQVKNMNLSGLAFEGANLSGKRFYSCSFSGSTFMNITFAACTFRMCFFNSCIADSCDFSGIDAQFCSFAGTRFSNVSFEHSEIVHNNFDGAKTIDCTFNYSNLYNSRFILSEFEKTDFTDCNLKRSFIIPAKEIGVSWHLSNTEEAIRELDRLEI
jgi:uncharacterized protein YjbI with pentapeptide repeats